MIGVTVTHDDTNTPLGDDQGLEGSSSLLSVAPAEPITPPADLAEVVEEGGRPSGPLRADTGVDDELGELDDDRDDDEPFVVSPYDRPGRWFVVHTYAGYENKVKSNLDSRIRP